MDIILISGKQGSGKTTLQQLIGRIWHDRFGAKVTYVNFADILYEMHDSVLGVLNRYWPRRSIVKDGPLLQLLGTDWGRKTIDEEIWVKCLQKKIQEAPEGLLVVGDCRFENEFDGIPEALRVRLECPEEGRKARCSMWRENTEHPSEVGLDRYSEEGRFDLTFKTNELTSLECAKIIESTICARSWKEKRKNPEILEATRHLTDLVTDVNASLRQIEEETKCRANFQWGYNAQTGLKELRLGDVALYNPPSDAVVSAAKKEVPAIMEKAEALVGKPVEVVENDRPSAQ